MVGAVLWQRKLDSAPVGTPIMPDGCLDLLWDGNRLFVAGPDTAARCHRSPAGTTYVALRFSGGLGPTLLGVPADELRDRTANLDELWPGRQVRVLTEQVEVQPAAALEAWVVKRAARCDQDPLGPRVLAMAKAGTPIAVMAERLCISPRQLHRRCLPAFGYGPRRLARIMRFQRALAKVRCGCPWPKWQPVAGMPTKHTSPGRCVFWPARRPEDYLVIPTRTAAERTGRPAGRRDRGQRHSACPRTHPTARGGPRSRRQ